MFAAIKLALGLYLGYVIGCFLVGLALLALIFAFALISAFLGRRK